jgi:hypothetical protein
MSSVMLGMAVGLIITTTADANDLTWRNDIEPIVKSQCASCHGADAPIYEEWNRAREKWTKQNVGPRMHTYADFTRHVVWPATGSVMRRLDDGKASDGGKPGNMYEFLGRDDAERTKNLATIKAWMGEGAWNLNRWETRGKVPGITKEQLDKIKAKY